MPIFQKSVVNKYLKGLDENIVNQAYTTYNNYFKDHFRLSNIMQLKEENYQEGFLRELFVDVLGYTINPNKNFNLTTEYKNQTDSKKADGAIIKEKQAIGVIELKSTKMLDLKYITNQAFNYKHNQPNCRYVITSNFHFLRLYIDNSIQYEEFNLFHLDFESFKCFYLFLSKESIFNNIPISLKEETKFHEESISTRFYRDYKQFKEKIFENLVKNNKQYDKIILLKKTQKLLDRVLFIAFAEDKGLIPPNALSRTIDKWKNLIREGDSFTLYARYQLFFNHLNAGFIVMDWGTIPAYNGGLYAFDDILDNKALIIDNKILQEGVLSIAKYDFNTEIDVNILGHIFEHSLNELDEIIASSLGKETDKKQTKRKKDGVFYTPDYITKYIVENTIGEYCERKKIELDLTTLQELSNLKDKKGKLTKKGKEYFDKIQAYKNWLYDLKILDPACGSGAFLIAALDFLISEHKQTDDLMYQISGEAMKLFDTDKTILEKNIYGVDINEESVEIAKLSLWLHTAKKERKLSNLSGNIKCGNSLIDNKKIAKEKAFVWQNEFSEIFANGGFDVIIGNPPYGAEMTKQQTDFLDVKYSEFKSITKNSAIYFIYQANILFKKDGYISFIIPKSICYSNGWNKCAEFLIPKLTKLIDTGKVFKDVLLEQIIFIYNQQSNQNYYKTGICEKGKVVELENINKSIFSNFKVFIAGNSVPEITIIDKITNNKYKYSDFVTIERGLNWQAKVQENNGNIPVYRGAQLDRYFLNKASDFVDLSKFNKNEYSYQINPKILNQLAIAHVLNPYPHFYLQAFCDTENRLVFETISCTFPKYNEIDIYFLLAFNNSKLFAWILYKFIYSNAIRSTRFDKKYVGRIPVPDLLAIDVKEISEKSRLITIYSQKINEKQNEFIQILLSNFKNIKINNKLRAFYNFEFNTLLEELKKQKVEIELKKQREWINFFNEYKLEINEIQRLKSETDKDLDFHIYQLYNLTPEEIQIIENAK